MLWPRGRLARTDIDGLGRGSQGTIPVRSRLSLELYIVSIIVLQTTLIT